MLKNRENQKSRIASLGSQFYTCVVDENDKLIAYERCPYINKNRQLDVDKIMEECTTLLNFDVLTFAKEEMTNVTAYSGLVDVILSDQRKAYVLKAVRDHMVQLSEGRPHGQIDAINQIVAQIEEQVRINEEIFKKISVLVPKNWPFLMFPESSWTSVPYNVIKHEAACGNVDFYADDILTSMKKIQHFSPENRQRWSDEFKAIQEDIDLQKDSINLKDTEELER